jgi:hypothetical protein
MIADHGERKGRRTIRVRVVIIVQTGGAALWAIVIPMVGLRLLDIVVVILPGIKRLVHVSRRGRSRITLLTAGAVMMASSHDDGRREATKVPEGT